MAEQLPTSLHLCQELLCSGARSVDTPLIAQYGSSWPADLRRQNSYSGPCAFASLTLASMGSQLPRLQNKHSLPRDPSRPDNEDNWYITPHLHDYVMKLTPPQGKTLGSTAAGAAGRRWQHSGDSATPQLSAGLSGRQVIGPLAQLVPIGPQTRRTTNWSTKPPSSWRAMPRSPCCHDLL